MAEAGATCVVVELDDGLGIVTDRDIRTRVVAAGAGPETPLSDVMTAPAWTVAADRTATEALLEMLDQGIRHLPVLTAGRRLLGVLDDVDLMANERRAPFRLRAAVARSSDAEEMAEAAADLPDTVIALFDAGLAPVSISRAIASIHDAVTRRMIEFTHQDLGRPPVPYTWLATGSFGRFEPFPSSDVDSAIVWEGPDDDPEIRRAIAALAKHVLEGLGKCGFEPDTKGAVASNPLFARSVEEWERAARTWIEHPDRDRGLLLLSVVIESDAVWGSTAMADHLARAFVDGSRPQAAVAEACLGRAGGAPAHRVPAQLRASLGRRAQGGARHQAPRPAPHRVARALERSARRRQRGLHAGTPHGVARGGHPQPGRRHEPARRVRAVLRAPHGAPGGAAPRGRGSR